MRRGPSWRDEFGPGQLKGLIYAVCFLCGLAISGWFVVMVLPTIPRPVEYTRESTAEAFLQRLRASDLNSALDLLAQFVDRDGMREHLLTTAARTGAPRQWTPRTYGTGETRRFPTEYLEYTVTYQRLGRPILVGIALPSTVGVQGRSGGISGFGPYRVTAYTLLDTLDSGK